MKRSIKTLLHIGFWLGYLIFLLIVGFAAFQGQDLKAEDMGYYASFATGVAIIPPVISFYSHYFYLFPKYLQHRKIFLSIVFGLLIAIGAALTGLLFSCCTNAEAANCIKTGFPYAFFFTVCMAVVFGIIALVLKGFGTWYKELKLKEELLEKKPPHGNGFGKSTIRSPFPF